MSRNAATAAERNAAIAAETEQAKAADGLTVYLGVVPAEIIKGPPTHVHLSKGPHEYGFLSKCPMNIKLLRPSSMPRVAIGFPTLS